MSSLDAVRESYDRLADTYVAGGYGDLEPVPWLRASLDVFAEVTRGAGPVLDVGCGPGQTTAYLAARGVDVRGIDLSPAMIGHARRLHPGVGYAVGSATDVVVPDGSLSGVLGWWSLFHLPRESFSEVLQRFSRMLMPGGVFLMGTHVGDGELVRTEAYGGVPVSWTTVLWQPEELRARLTAAGFAVEAELRLPPPPPGFRDQVLLSARRAP